jgi:hypothetical protein
MLVGKNVYQKMKESEPKCYASKDQPILNHQEDSILIDQA